MYKTVAVKKDPVKERLKELKTKPVLTPQENKEAIDKILDYLGIKEAE